MDKELIIYIGIIILFIGILFIALYYSLYYSSTLYGEECLQSYAKEYCLQQALTFHKVLFLYSGQFFCLGLQNRTHIEREIGYWFLPEELDSCKTKNKDSFKRLK